MDLGKKEENAQEVGVVVARLQRKVHGHARGACRGAKVLWQQLPSSIELIRCAARYLNVQGRPRVLGNEVSGVVGSPGCRICPQVVCKGLLAPGAGRGVRNGRKGARAPVLPRVAQRALQRAKAAHGVPRNGAAPHVHLTAQVRLEQRRQLLAHVRLHAPLRAPGRCSGVHVESRANAKVPAGGGALHLRRWRAARRSVREHQRNARSSCCREGRARLLCKVLITAGEAREPKEHGRRGSAPGRHKDGKCHGAARGGGRVRVAPQLTAARLPLLDELHCVC